MRNLIESLNRWIAWRLPKSLVYWCAIRLLAHATTGKNSRSPNGLNFMDALTAWERSN